MEDKRENYTTPERFLKRNHVLELLTDNFLIYGLEDPNSTVVQSARTVEYTDYTTAER